MHNSLRYMHIMFELATGQHRASSDARNAPNNLGFSTLLCKVESHPQACWMQYPANNESAQVW